MIDKKKNHFLLQFVKDVSIRIKIFGAFLLIIVLLGITFSVNGYFSFKALDDYHERVFAENIQSEIRARMDSNLRSSELSLLLIQQNPAVARAFAEKDRKALLDLFSDSYQNMKKMGVEQFQFHLPDSTSFLRLHKPEKYGDSLRSFRETVNEANRKKAPVRGLEEGRAGFGLRVVLPISYNGEHVGTVEFGRSFSSVFLNELKNDFGGEYFIYVFDREKSVAWKGSGSGFLSGTAQEDPSTVTDSMVEYLKKGSLTFVTDGTKQIESIMIPFQDFSGEYRGYIKSVQSRTDIYSTKAKALLVSAGIIATGILLSTVIAYIILILINGPLKKSMAFASIIASGDLTANISVDRYDETGKLIISLDNMRDHLRDLLKEINENAEFSNRAAAELAVSSSEVSRAATQVSVTMEELAAGATSLTDSARQAWKNVQSLNESQHKVNETANLGKREADQISESASTAGDAASRAEKMIGRIQSIMNETSLSVEDLTKRVQTIHEMTGSINAISEQINLLSLNASIEAARAGDAGRGFAVVAESVSKLADQSGNATDQINQSIADIVSSSENTLKNIELGVKEVSSGAGEIHNALNGTQQIHRMIQELVHRMDSIKQAANVQQGITEQVRESISLVSNVAEESAAGVEEVAASVEEISNLMFTLSESAEFLQGGSDRLKKLIERFRV